jgi:hypothetical protein
MHSSKNIVTIKNVFANADAVPQLNAFRIEAK